MSKINFKCFGDNIFSLLSPTMKTYTTIEFDKESLIKQIKSGTVEYSNINLRKERQIYFYGDFYLIDMLMKSAKITIPDDKENFMFEGNGIIVQVDLKSLDDILIEKLIIDMLKEMSDNFIKEAVASMDKNSKQPSFWDNIAESLYKNLIFNMRMYLKDITLNLTRGDDCFTLSFDEIDFSNETGITRFQGAKISLMKNKDKLTEYSIIDKCTFELHYNRETHLLKLHTDSMKFNITPNVCQAIMDAIQERDDNKNKVKCYKRKRTARYSKQQPELRDKAYHLNLWKYAITTVVKLRKYVLLRWYTVFNLDLSQYESLAIDYYNNTNAKEENMLLMQKHLFLRYSRSKVEDLILQNKKKPSSNSIMNLFFVKSGSTSGKPTPASLSPEEQAILDKVYSKESIKKFIKGNWSDPIFLLDKFTLFMTKIGFDIFIQNFNLCINNNHSTLSFNLNQLSYDFIVDDRADWWESYNLRFNEIGNYKATLYQEKTQSFLIKIKSYQKTELEFGFKHLVLSKELIDFFMLFSSYTHFHSWSNVLIKSPRKREFKLNEFGFTSIPNISFKHQNVHLMLSIYSFGCFSPSEMTIEFEVKEKHAKNSVISRNKVVLSYFREKMNKYVLQLNDFLCFVSMPIALCLFELRTISDTYRQSNQDGNNNNKQIEDFETNERVIAANHNEGSFDFKYKDAMFRFETQISKIQIGLMENESKPSLMLTNLKIMQRNNEIMFNLAKAFISFNKQSTLLFSLFYNQLIINSKPSQNKTQEYQPNGERSILLQSQSNVIEFGINNSTLQLITNNMTILNNSSKISFNSKSVQLTYLSSGFQEVISLIKLNNDLIIEYSLIHNKLLSRTSHPLMHFDLPIIDELIAFTSSFESLLKQDNSQPNLYSSPSLSISNNINTTALPFKYEINIATPKLMFDRFKYEMSKLDITNQTNLQALNISCFNFLMSNERMELIKENKLSIDVILNQNNELYCEIYFNYLHIYFLQQDITNLINSFDYESSMQKYQRITRLMGSNEWRESNKSRNSANSINNRNSPSITKKNLKVKIPKWDVDFSLDTKEKLLQVSSEGISLDMIIDQEDKIETEFKITKLSSSFNQFNNTQFYLISQNSDWSISNKKDPNQLLELTEFTTPQYQLAVSFKDNLIDINLSSVKMFLRVDAFFTIYSYFITAVPDQHIYSQVKEINSSLKVRCLFIDSCFVLQTSFDNKETLIIQIDQFYSLFQTLENKMASGQLFIQINSLKAQFVEESKRRKLIDSKNDFLICKCHILEDSLNISMVFDTIVIHLSYKDIISFLKAYHIGLYYFNQEKRVPSREVIDDFSAFASEKNNSKNNGNSSIGYQIAFEIGKIDITLIDNLQNSYYPFLNFNMNKLNIDIIPDQVDISAIPSIHSYNYISCDWEPSLEPVLVQLQYKKTSLSLARKQIVTCYVLQDILINLSDMNISLTWGALSRWIERFLEEKKTYEKSFEGTQLINIGSQILITDDISYISKISNNNIRNISGNEFGVIYQGNKFTCPSGYKIDLEYLNEIESNGSNKEIELLFSNHTFKFPIEKIGVRMHRIDKDCFFISEISLTKQLSIEISLYSPVIFHNKSQYGITIVFNNNDNQDSYFMILPSKSKQGVPFSHLKSSFDIYFSNVLPNTNQSLSVAEILNTPVDKQYLKQLYIENKHLILKLLRVLQNVRKLVINPEHVIVNYLPCALIINYGGNTFSVKKSSVKELDLPCSLKLLFSVQVGNELFYSQIDKFFEIQDKVFYIGFKNTTGQVFYVTALLLEKETQKVLVLYSEYLIKNNTGLNLQIKSKAKDNGALCFRVGYEVYLISSNPDLKNSWFSLSPYCFQSKKIFLNDLLSEASEYSVKMATKDNRKLLNVNIQTNVSYMPKTSISLTEMLCTVIFTIQPIYKITNLLENKWIFIASDFDKNDHMVIAPLTTFPFHFFNNGKASKVCFGVALTAKSYPSEWTEPFYINNFDFYTCCVNDNIFNVEIRQNNEENITDVFITKSTANNSKILISNQTKYQLVVYQKDNDSRIQIINSGKKEQFNVYSLANNELSFEIANKTINIRLKEIKKPRTSHLNDDVILYTESNDLKTYLTFYNVNQYNALLPEAKQFNFDLNFTSIYISLIGDNKYKDKKLVNYIRNELLLMELKNIQVQILQKTNRSLLNKINSQVTASLETINIFNQISTYGKFSMVLSSSNLASAIYLSTDCDIYPLDKICKINSLTCDISKLLIGIDPNFVGEIIYFVNNVIYRMNIINFNVDDIFIKKDNNANDENSNSSNVKDNNLIESYQANSMLYSLTNFKVPHINFSFELSKIGLKSLLKRQFNFSSILSSILSNLAGETHSIKLSSYSLSTYLVTIENLVSMILTRYYRALFSECHKIGFKGVLLGITHLFKQKEQESDSVKINRRRFPRPFYGQYKSIRKYDESHAYIYEMMINAFGNFRSSYHFTDGIRTSSGIILFTTMSLFIFNLNNQLEKSIDYFYIKTVTVVNSKVIIEFNQQIDNRFSQTINFPTHETSELIGRKLLQAIEDSSDPIQMLN